MKIAAVLGGLGALVLLIVVDVFLGLPSPVSGGLSGLIGVGIVYGAGARTYASGTTWFRRGTQIVHTQELASIIVRQGVVELLDTRRTEHFAGWLRQGRCTFPLAVLHDHPELYGPLRQAIDVATSRRPVRVNAEANQAFALGFDPARISVG